MARLLKMLAELYHAMGQDAKAEPLAERAVAIYDLAEAAPGNFDIVPMMCCLVSSGAWPAGARR